MTTPAALTTYEQVSSRPATTLTGRTYTFTADDALVQIVTTNALSVTLTLLADSVVDWPEDTLLQVIQGGAGAVTIDRGTGVTVNAVAGDYTLSAQNAWLYLKKTAANTWYLTKFGDGSMGATVFTGLSDTPGSYTGGASKLLRVNAGATAVEFANLTTAMAAGFDSSDHIGVNDTTSSTRKLSVRSQSVRFSAVYVADGGNGNVAANLRREASTNHARVLYYDDATVVAGVGVIADDNLRGQVYPSGVETNGWVVDATSGSTDLREVESTVASASTCDIGAVTTMKVAISGTTTITSLGTVAYRMRFVRFTGAMTLTHNGTSLILPGGVNILTVAGDTALFLSDGSGNWRCDAYNRTDRTTAITSNRNLIGNAQFDVWQRNTTFTLSSGTKTKIADLWHGYRNSTNCTMSRQAGFSGAQYCLRVAKTAGASSTGISVYHQIESSIATQLAGKTITFSFDVRKGSSYDGAGVSASLYTGVGTDETFTASTSTFVSTTTAVGIFTTAAVGSSATRLTGTVAVPSDCTEAVIRITYGQTTTTGDANHYVEITNCKLEIGPAATRYEPEPMAVIMERCERRFQKTFLQATAPAQNAGAGTGEYRATATIAGANVNRLGTYVFSTPMRIAPTPTTYNPAAASADARDITNSVNCTTTTVENVTEKSCGIIATGNAATTVGAQIGVHLSLDAEFA